MVVPCTHLFAVCMSCYHNAQHPGGALTHAGIVQVLVSGWVNTVQGFRHAFACWVEQKIWLAMKPPSGVYWGCLSLCGLCTMCVLVSTNPAALLSADVTLQAAHL